MAALGDLNTRERDWADVWRLTGVHDLDGRSLSAATDRTATYREVTLRPLSEVIERLPQTRQQPYTAWRRRQSGDADAYPDRFAEVVRQVLVFADPLLAGRVDGLRWLADDRRWDGVSTTATHESRWSRTQ